jgi:adenylate cyclase
MSGSAIMALPSRIAEPKGSASGYHALVTAWGGRVRALIGAVPVNVPPEHRRAYVLTLSGYLFTLVAHVSLFIIFMAAGEFRIAAVAAAGAAGFGICLVAHWQGYYRAPPHLATLIVAIDGFLGSYFLGAVGGFQLYILGAIIYPWLTPFIGRPLKLTYTVLGIFGFAGLYVLGVLHEPAHPLAWPWPPVLAAMNAAGVAGMLIALIVAYEIAVERAENEARRANAESEALLLNILPRKVAAQLKHDPHAIAELHGEVTIVFADIVDFTPLSLRLHPLELVRLLNDVFSAFDELAVRYGVEKIKTIGDAYMAVCGLPEPRADHAQVIADLALDMLTVVQRFTDDTGAPMTIRVGISSGTVVAGVIGTSKFLYDLWGDPVNTAGRMESYSLPGRIQVSEATQQLLKKSHRLESRGEIDVKGKGKAHTWFLTGRLAAQRSASVATAQADPGAKRSICPPSFF